jgi:uncharacterized protein YndB with AHSA1/START domain
MEKITIETAVAASVEKVWEFFTNPFHVMEWNHASDDWHSPRAVNDLRVGGSFNYHMEAKDGSAGFDFEGTYDEVIPHQLIRYTMGDGRAVQNIFEGKGENTRLVISFDPETENPIEMQRAGWQSILDNFRRYAESGA